MAIEDFHRIDFLLHVSTDRAIRRTVGGEARICPLLHFRDVMPFLFDLISHSELPLGANFAHFRQIRLLWNRTSNDGKLRSLGLLHILL